ncbi:MAG: hypothetical protein K2M59_05265, partial [Muribaculaceae bacterium]|nr:hypothetical protein [Muribaculaceae bacterium]
KGIEAANLGQREARSVQALKGIEAANLGQREARSVQALKGIEAARPQSARSSSCASPERD